jgi:hypothetical protein
MLALARMRLGGDQIVKIQLMILLTSLSIVANAQMAGYRFGGNISDLRSNSSSLGWAALTHVSNSQELTALCNGVASRAFQIASSKSESVRNSIVDSGFASGIGNEQSIYIYRLSYHLSRTLRPEDIYETIVLNCHQGYKIRYLGLYEDRK